MEKKSMESCDLAMQQALTNAVERLASIQSGNKKSALLEQKKEKKPLMAVLRIIGNAMGIPIRAPKYPDDIKRQEFLLKDVAKVSKFRIRKVRLRNNWWQKDNGVLLAFQNDQPVALLPRLAQGYDIYDPLKRKCEKLAPKMAELLSPFAYTFYRTLPDHSLTGKDLIRFGIKGCASDILKISLLSICTSLLGLLTPIMTRFIFDAIIPDAGFGLLIQVGIILIACMIAVAMFEITKGIALLRVEDKIGAYILAGVWDRLIHLPIPFFRKYTTGDLVDRAMGIDSIRQILSGITVNTLLGFIFSTTNIVLLFYYCWRLALVAIGFSLIGFIVIGIASYIKVRIQREMQKIEGKNVGIVFQFIKGISKLRSTGTENIAFKQWAENFAQKKEHALKAGNIEILLNSFIAVFPILSLMAIFAWVIFKEIGGEMRLTLGKFLAFNAAYNNYQNAILQVIMTLPSLLIVIPLYERVKPIIQTLPETTASKSDPGDLTGDIKLNHVCFRYNPESPLILKDITLHIPAGKFIALVGDSGSGKSTLFRLLLGFEAPESGNIYYDGKELASLDILQIRRQIGVVLQDSKLVPGSIFTNIIGASDLTKEDALRAAKIVGFDEIIENLPMEMFTIVSEGGGNLSAGQRQQLLIARAIAKNPCILYLDEATSAMDNKTQAVVIDGLKQLESTIVTIAHRLSTIIHADFIYVIHEGKLIESGTYEELMRNNKYFYRLMKRQGEVT